MSCYHYKTIYTTHNPVFKNVDITIILMMENSKRFIPDPFLLSLTKKTVIQYNKGYKACEKKGIHSSNMDINHAYCTAFKYCQQYNNVLVLEEDAEILNYNKTHYEKIDEYINSNNFNQISFGDCGYRQMQNEMFYMADRCSGAQAQIISRRGRKNISNSVHSYKYDEHIDFHMRDVLIYKHPLVVQLFPPTENSKTWRSLTETMLMKLVRLDRDKNSWHVLYFFRHNEHNLVKIAVLIAALCVYFIYYKLFYGK